MELHPNMTRLLGAIDRLVDEWNAQGRHAEFLENRIDELARAKEALLRGLLGLDDPEVRR